MLKSLGTNMDHSDSDESSTMDSDSEVEIDEIVNKAIIDLKMILQRRNSFGYLKIIRTVNVTVLYVMICGILHGVLLC